MAFIVEDFVKETTTTTGTGDITLAGTSGRGAAIPFATVCANGDTFPYAISHTSSNEWEVGIGTFHSPGSTFTRTTVQRSSNANAAVNFSAGTKNVDLTLTSTHIKQLANIAGLTGVLRADSGVPSVDSDVTDIVAAATTGAAGKVALANTTELLTGTDTAKATTCDAIAALWEKGADNSGGATITLGDGYQFDLITSTTTITALAFTTDKAGRMALLRFATARSVTHNATSLISPTGANISMGIGDLILVESLGSGNFRIITIWRNDVVQNLPGVVALTANGSQSGTTTNIDCGTFTIPANTLRVGSAYRLYAHYVFTKTAAPPTLTFEVLINGVVVETLVATFTASAATVGGWVSALVVCRTTGSTGTAMITMTQETNGGSAIASQLMATTGTATDTVDTTVSRSLQLRARMTTGVASNVLTIVQGLIEKVN